VAINEIDIRLRTRFGRFSARRPANREDILNIDSQQVRGCDIYSGLISLQQAHIATLKESRGSANLKDPWGPYGGPQSTPWGP